jgi:FlaA1/EpsC-like NDP-sugar epimerase
MVCLPAASVAESRTIRSALIGAGAVCRTLPMVEDLVFGRMAVRTPNAEPAMHDLDLPALVGRRARSIDARLARRAITGKRVLITGAGGSIGSALARQTAGLAPEALLLVERSENALFEIDREIGARTPRVPRRAVLHDVVDARATRRILAELRPHVVFHAAAHKHVPMMEDHPAQAITNNLFGTKSIADAAVEAGAERFVMISTDKAVNPASVMGATKRMAELCVRGLSAERPGTRLCMVRFGNVLGSSGSVLQVWARQIEQGGPVTVTDARMTRYFMTIPEAAALVIEAGALTADEAGGADVFVLDMGDPVRIVDLAARFIRAAGLEPVTGGVSPAPPGAVQVVFTGIRPGEKLDEELAHSSERLRPTPVEGVFSWAGESVDPGVVRDMIVEMDLIRGESDQGIVLEGLQRWAPMVGQPPSGRCTQVVGAA